MEVWKCVRLLWEKHYPGTQLDWMNITLRWQHGLRLDSEGMNIGRDFLLKEFLGEESSKKKGAPSLVKNQKPLVVNAQVEYSLVLAAQEQQEEEELAAGLRLEDERTKVRHVTF